MQKSVSEKYLPPNTLNIFSNTLDYAQAQDLGENEGAKFTSCTSALFVNDSAFQRYKSKFGISVSREVSDLQKHEDFKHIFRRDFRQWVNSNLDGIYKRYGKKITPNRLNYIMSYISKNIPEDTIIEADSYALQNNGDYSLVVDYLYLNNAL